MASSDQEIDLSARVARMLGTSWSEYWASSDSEISAGMHMARARSIYDLVGEVMYSSPGEGWSDRMLVYAATLLATLGDGYALTSIEWPGAISERALPNHAANASVYAGHDMQTWLARAGRAPSLVPMTSRKHDLVSPSLRAGSPSRPVPEFDSSFEELVDRERPDWDRFEMTGDIVAKSLTEWLPVYPRYVHAMRSAQAPEALRGLHERRPVFIRNLAFARESQEICYPYGAKAEAVAGLAVLIALMRSLILASTSSDGADFEALQLLSLPQLGEIVEACHLDTWIDALALIA